MKGDCCGPIPRRSFLADAGMGFTGLVLGSMLGGRSGAQDEAANPPSGTPNREPRARSVIWIFMVGGVSHVESFDPKPVLTQYAGKSISDTPYRDLMNSPRLKEIREFVAGQHKPQPVLFPMQTGFRKYGRSGIEVSDWWPHVGDRIDDIAVVRSLYTTDNDHGAQLQFHTGRHMLEGPFPTIGSWVHYGLGRLNENLPQFVVLGTPLSDCCGGVNGHGASYLGPEHAGVRVNPDPANPIPFASPGRGKFREEQEKEFELLLSLDRLSGLEYPRDQALRARIKSYELAFRMQAAVPEVFRLDAETNETRRMYGLDQEPTKSFGIQCLAARRLVERGVRFVQIYHGSTGGAGAWDAHTGLKKSHGALSHSADKPIAGLLRDLKQRGLLEETIVVWATEFGRTPGAEKADGRDHHPFGFSAWLAGGGIKGGVTHGATDEIGFYAVENRHYVTDIHATVLHQLGIDSKKLEVPGRKRLEIDHGRPIHEIIA